MHTILVCVAEAWVQKFKSLSRTPKWTGRTPASAQDDHVSIAVLRFLHSFGDDGWGKVDDMWQAKCMPLWGLVRRKEIDFKPCFVVKVYSYCFITWPAVEIAKKIWMPDMDVKRLDTPFATNLAEWEDYPTRVRSPISAAVRNDMFRSNVDVSCILSHGRLSHRLFWTGGVCSHADCLASILKWR